MAAAATTTAASTTTQLRGFRLREMQSTTSDKTFHLKWNNHLQNLSQLFTAIYTSSALADVTLSCRDGAIRAHKLVLSACSPYFEQIFRDNPCKHPVIILKGIPYAEINLLVEFMYKGSVDVQEIDLQSLMHTASELEIRGLAYELRKDASSLLNVNLNEFPSQSSNATQDGPFSSVDVASHTGDGAHHSNVSRMQQIHLYQQSMSRSGYSNQQVNPSCFEAKRKRKSEEPMPATTTTAVKNILAAAAKELAEKKPNLGKSKSSASIQTEDEDLDMKVETYESDSGEGESHVDSEELPHGRDTRFKGKKRVSVGLDDEYVPVRGALKNSNKPNKKNVKLTFKMPNSPDSPANDASDDAISKVVITAVTGGDGSAQTPATGLLKCVNLDNLRENPRESVTIIDDDDSSAVDTSDENNLLVETAYESAPGADDDYDSSDSKPFRKVDDKLYKCDLCNLSFVRKYHMKRHRRTHTGERPFQCDVCPFSFNRSSHLARHRRTHTGERPYRCEACGRTFTRGDKLKLHLRVCEKDEYVLPSHLNSDDRKPTKVEISQAVLPGMVSTAHSESHQLMFTSSGDVMLAPRSQPQSHAQPQPQSDTDPNTTSEINESNQSLLMMNDSNASQLNLSAMATPSTSDTSIISNQFFSLDALGFPIKRGRGRPRKKPLPVDVPLVKKKRGRPPKVIKLDPNEPPTPTGPVENYNVSNLPYGDFSYLTDMITSHINQTNQAYQNMIQLNPAAAANLLSNAVVQMHGTSILVNPNASSTDIKALASNVLSQNNKRIAVSQPSNTNESPVLAAESKPSDVAGSSVKIQNLQVNNENAVPNDAGKNENTQNESAESDSNKLAQNNETSEEGDNSQMIKLPNLPNTTVDVVPTNKESSVVPLTVGECTIKAISNN